MRSFFYVSLSLLLVSCASTEPSKYDARYSHSEIGTLTAQHFDVDKPDAVRALGPMFQKYGKPHGYIDGLMSSIDDPRVNFLYGSGYFQTKLNLNEHTFWRLEGEKLNGHLKPVKAAHIIYDTTKLSRLNEALTYKESLTKRGQKFSIFEHKIDNKIVVTVYRQDDLPEISLEALKFYSE